MSKPEIIVAVFMGAWFLWNAWADWRDGLFDRHTKDDERPEGGPQ